ncbi:hypothetical protein DFH09DRAFT_1280579, partial [Mycena vulgaris]
MKACRLGQISSVLSLGRSTTASFEQQAKSLIAASERNVVPGRRFKNSPRDSRLRIQAPALPQRSSPPQGRPGRPKYEPHSH